MAWGGGVVGVEDFAELVEVGFLILELLVDVFTLGGREVQVVFGEGEFALGVGVDDVADDAACGGVPGTQGAQGGCHAVEDAVAEVGLDDVAHEVKHGGDDLLGVVGGKGGDKFFHRWCALFGHGVYHLFDGDAGFLRGGELACLGVAACGELSFLRGGDKALQQGAQVGQSAVFGGVAVDEFAGKDVFIQRGDDGVGLCKGDACAFLVGVGSDDAGGALGVPLDVVGDAQEGGVALTQDGGVVALDGAAQGEGGD